VHDPCAGGNGGNGIDVSDLTVDDPTKGLRQQVPCRIENRPPTAQYPVQGALIIVSYPSSQPTITCMAAGSTTGSASSAKLDSSVLFCC
jgi:hypothetical protein